MLDIIVSFIVSRQTQMHPDGRRLVVERGERKLNITKNLIAINLDKVFCSGKRNILPNPRKRGPLGKASPCGKSRGVAQANYAARLARSTELRYFSITSSRNTKGDAR